MFIRKYYKDIATLFLGSGISHSIPILMTPILTRLYTPNDYGIFILFLSILSVTTMVSAGKYYLAIVLSKDDNNANILKNISLLLNMFFLLSSFIVIIICYYFSFFNNVFLGIGNLILLLPLATFFYSLFDIINYVLNRNKEYESMKNIRILRGFFSEGSSLVLGLLKLGSAGLILGSMLGNIIPSFFYKEKILSNIKSDRNEIKLMMGRYKEFPLYHMPTSILDSFSLQSPIYFFTAFYSLEAVAMLGLSQRLFALPISLISKSVSQVFYKEAADVNNKNQNLNKIYNKTFKMLFFIALPIAMILFFFSEYIFSLVLGESFGEVGMYVKYLTPAFLIRFIVSPLSPIFLVRDKIKILAIWKVIYFITSVVTLLSSCLMINIDQIHYVIIIYSFHEVILYSIYFILQSRIK